MICTAKGADWECDKPTKSPGTDLCNGHTGQRYRGVPLTKLRYRGPKTTPVAGPHRCTATGPEWCCTAMVPNRRLCPTHADQRLDGRPFTPRPAGIVIEKPKPNVKPRVVPIKEELPPGTRRCVDCKVIRPLTAFPANKRDGYKHRCKSCDNVFSRCKDHGITVSEYDYLLLLQDDSCALCRKPFGGTPQIDHAHSCCIAEYSCGTCVRGLLCGTCNARLLVGYEQLPIELQDSPTINEYLMAMPINNYRELDTFVDMCEV